MTLCSSAFKVGKCPHYETPHLHKLSHTSRQRLLRPWSFLTYQKFFMARGTFWIIPGFKSSAEGQWHPLLWPLKEALFPLHTPHPFKFKPICTRAECISRLDHGFQLQIITCLPIFWHRANMVSVSTPGLPGCRLQATHWEPGTTTTGQIPSISPGNTCIILTQNWDSVCGQSPRLFKPHTPKNDP